MPIRNRADVIHALKLMHQKYNIKAIIVKGILVDQDGNRIEHSFFDVKDQIPSGSKYKQPTTLIAEHGADRTKVKMILIGSVLEDPQLHADPSASPSQPVPQLFEISFDYFDFVFGGTGDVFAAAFLSSLLRPSAKDSQRITFDSVKSACEISVCITLNYSSTFYFTFCFLSLSLTFYVFLMTTLHFHLHPSMLGDRYA